jgi:hypothetical protein
MEELGYRVGRYDEATGRLVGLSRRDQVMYRLSPDHLPPFMRLTEHPLVPYVAFDFANSLTWAESPWAVPMDEALAECDMVRTVGDASGVSLRSLTLPYAFLFTTLHLFREAWFERTAAEKTTLGFFCDIVRFWRRYRPELCSILPDMVERFGLADPVSWVCAHTDEIFGTSITVDLGLQQHATDTWLHSARGTDGRPLSWKGTMRARLQRKDGLDLHPVSQPTAPGVQQ